MRFAGIDPGVSGGVAVITEEGKPQLVQNMPATERELWHLFHQIAAFGDVVAVLEKLAGAPQLDGRPLQTPKTMLTMGTNYGLLRMGLTAAGIRFDDAAPRKWQGMFGLVFGKERKLTSTQKKNRHKAKAEQLFPDVRTSRTPWPTPY